MLERQILVNVQLQSVISKPMKTPRSSTRNHLLSHVRLPAAIPLMAAAGDDFPVFLPPLKASLRMKAGTRRERKNRRAPSPHKI
jgi:hypothetical protein